MTRLTAKKGMMEYKSGHGKEDYDFAYMKDIPYDDKHTLSLHHSKMEENMNKVLDDKCKALQTALDDLTKKYEDLRKTFEETLKGWMTR